MSRSMMKCGNCGTPAYRKKASYCEICGHNQIIPDEAARIKPKTKTDQPTRKELESQIKNLQTEKERLEKTLRDKIEELNQKSLKCIELEKITDPQALENAQKEIIELEYSQYLLDEELICVRQNLSDTEEQALEVFDKLIDAQSRHDPEEEKGGKSIMMRPEKKSRFFKKGRKVPLWKRIMAIVLNSLGLIIIIGLLIYCSVMLKNLTNQEPRPTPSSPTATPLPTSPPTPKPTLSPTATIKPTAVPTATVAPTLKPTPTIKPTPTPTSKPTSTAKPRLLTGKGKSLPFKAGDTVVGWAISVDGGYIEGRVVLYDSPVDGILIDGVINPDSWEIHDEKVITLNNILN